MNRMLISTALLFGSALGFAQTDSVSIEKLIATGDSLVIQQEFSLALTAYESAFDKGYNKVEYYVAAAMCATMEEKYEVAIQYVEKYLNSKEPNPEVVNFFTVSPQFAKLTQQAEWKKIETKLLEIQKNKRIKYNQALSNELMSILYSDQQVRQEYSEANSPTEMKLLSEKMKSIDKENHEKITHILDTYGWVGAEEVGETASLALFLVMQHADLYTQIKYRPMMEQAVMNGKLRPDNFALLIDRIEMRQNRPQIYGTQIIPDDSNEPVVYPIKYIDEVDVRRNELGLVPLSVYVEQMTGKPWNKVEYKKQLPQLEKRYILKK